MFRKSAVAIVLTALLIWDVSIPPPSQQVTAKAAIFAIKVYQHTFGRLYKNSRLCRFQPTCSNYGIQAFQKYGTIKGFWKTTWRILRCSPFTRERGYDPP